MSLLDPSECARSMRVSLDFIYREIAAGRLVARRHESAQGRIMYRIAADDWQAYLAGQWPKPDRRTEEIAPHVIAEPPRPPR